MAFFSSSWQIVNQSTFCGVLSSFFHIGCRTVIFSSSCFLSYWLDRKHKIYLSSSYHLVFFVLALYHVYCSVSALHHVYCSVSALCHVYHSVSTLCHGYCFISALHHICCSVLVLHHGYCSYFLLCSFFTCAYCEAIACPLVW